MSDNNNDEEYIEEYAFGNTWHGDKACSQEKRDELDTIERDER